MRDLTLITPTADQPTGIALLERYMQDQTAWGRVARWVVADDGTHGALLTLRQDHVRLCHPPRAVHSLCANLAAGLALVETPYVAIIEHDDLYHPRYLEELLSHLERPGVLAAGGSLNRYYHVGLRLYRHFGNPGAALCQTGLRREAIGYMSGAIEECRATASRGVDAAFWRRITDEARSTYETDQVVGIKGLPGRPGIGIGHRPLESGYEWQSDPDGVILRQWCGEHAAHYEGYYEVARCPA
jgi:hypothetical protein